MKRMFLPLLLIAILLGDVLGCSGAGIEPQQKTVPPGAVMAQAISTVTGVAISPLLGASAVGAWKYFSTPPTERAKLSWYAQPWFWISALVVLGLCAAKDTFGMAVPAILKKPFDIIEAVGHKVGGLIALGVFVPTVATIFHSAGVAEPPGLDAMNGNGFLAMAQPAAFYNTIAVTISAFVFIIVFFASNAVNVLILLSPFPVIDAALKLFRLFVLGTVVLTSLVNPWFGLFWSLIIIGIAWLIAGWSFRLSHFGTVFIWDFCTFAAFRFQPDKTANWMFLAHTIDKVPARTYGKFLREESGNFVFLYRPWIILPQRRLDLPQGFYVISKGMICSEIMRMDQGKSRNVMLLPPHFRSHEEALAKIYGMSEVRVGGLRAAWEWLKDGLGFKTQPVLAVR